MRFVFVSSMTHYPWGGSEELWSQTACRLRQDGHELLASVNYWPEPPGKLEALHRAGIRFQIRNYGSQSLARRAWNRAWRLPTREQYDLLWIQKQQPDLVVISQGGLSDGLNWMRFCLEVGLPYVVICQCNSESWWPTDIDAALMLRVFPAAKKIFFVSQANRELCERQIGVRLENASLVRNPFNVSPSQPVPWPAESGTWRLACVARLDPFPKGQDLLFQMLAQPRWRERDVELNLYGTGPFAAGLKRLADLLQLKNVRFHGHTHDVAGIWADNHLLALPSRLEGLPLALVEAMWCGRPAVVTDVAGNAELCAHGETGFVAAAPTTAILAEAFELAWNRRHQWQEMGLAARRRIEGIVPRDPVGVFADQLNLLARSCSSG